AFGTLAAWIDGQLAPGAFEEAPAQPAPQEAQAVPQQPAYAGPAGETACPTYRTNVPQVASTGLEALLREQMQTFTTLMNRQFELLGGMKAAPAPAPAVAQPVSTPTAKPVPQTVAAPAAPETPAAHGPFKPVSKGQTGGLTPAQQQHLDALIARYNERTKTSKQMAQQYRRPLCDPRAVAGFRAQ